MASNANTDRKRSQEVFEPSDAPAATDATPAAPSNVDAALRVWTYYSPLDDVFEYESVPCTEYKEERVFTSLIRAGAPSFTTRSGNARSGAAVYTKTEINLDPLGYEAAIDSTRSSATAREIFPTDIFHRDSFGVDLAHLIPHSSPAASTYADVAIWSLGLDKNASWEKVQRAIHGVKPINDTTSGRRSSRVSDTGIKHSITNKICLQGQATYFDKCPCVYIIPVMTVEEMREWNGQGYKAIVMTSNWGTSTAAMICSRIGMIDPGDVATFNDIERAGTLLKYVILGMAHWLTVRSLPSVLNTSNDTEARSRLDKLRQDFVSNTTDTGGVKVPRAASLPGNTLKVRIVKFYDHGESKGHPAPDPMLLAAKAARNWCQTHDQPLKAAAEPQEEEWDELDDLAVEQYLDWRQDCLRPKTWDDLARGLGQPNGYQDRAQEG